MKASNILFGLLIAFTSASVHADVETAQKLADKENLSLLGQEIGHLVTDVTLALTYEYGARASSGEYKD